MSRDMDCVNPYCVMIQQNGAGSEQYYLQIVNPPIHPGSTHAPMPQHYVLPDQRRIERVPRSSHLSPPHESIPAITFSVNGFPGVRVKDISRVTLDAANDAVLEALGFRSIVISIEWPGYNTRNSGDPMRARVDALPGGRGITRQNLAKEICGLLINCHSVISKRPISPGWERWALTAGSEGIRVSDIVLFSLHYYRNAWVPELYVIE